MIGLNLELFGQLAIDRLDTFAHVIDQLPHHSWELGLLIRARQPQQANQALFRLCRVDRAIALEIYETRTLCALCDVITFSRY